MDFVYFSFLLIFLKIKVDLLNRSDFCMILNVMTSIFISEVLRNDYHWWNPKEKSEYFP